MGWNLGLRTSALVKPTCLPYILLDLQALEGDQDSGQ